MTMEEVEMDMQTALSVMMQRRTLLHKAETLLSPEITFLKNYFQLYQVTPMVTGRFAFPMTLQMIPEP